MAAQAGILYSDLRPIADDVVETLAHVNSGIAPDRRGVFTSAGIAVLSFASHFDRLSSTEHQPVHSSDDTVLTWDGRLDNRDDLLVRLGDIAHREATDAALVGAALHLWGHDALPAAIGDWSLARWNQRKRTLLLARDYTGNRPLYYCVRRDSFVWSTAIEAIVALCDLAGNINDEYILSRIVFNPIQHATPYSGILSVPPGCAVEVGTDLQPRVKQFAEIVLRTIRYRTKGDYGDRYRELLTQAVKVRLRTRTPVWTELSGGYDSSSLTCIASALVQARAVEAPKLQPLSHVAPGSPESDESVYVAAVEQACALRSIRIPFVGRFQLDPLTPDGQGGARDFSPRLTHELVDESGSHVLLSGEFGDALTMPVDLPALLVYHIRRLQFASLVSASVSHCRVTRSPLTLLALATLRELRRSTRRDREWVLRAVASRRHLKSTNVAAIFGLREDFIARFPLLPNSTDDLFARVPVVRRRLLEGIHYFLSWNGFSALRGNSPVRVAYPFLHKPLVEFMLGVPPETVWSPVHPRAFVCEALRDVLPQAIISRGTKGYAPPALARYLRPAIIENMPEIADWQLVQRGYAEPSTLIQMFKAFLDGSQAIGPSVKQLLIAERLLRKLACTARHQRGSCAEPRFAAGARSAMYM